MVMTLVSVSITYDSVPFLLRLDLRRLSSGAKEHHLVGS